MPGEFFMLASNTVPNSSLKNGVGDSNDPRSPHIPFKLQNTTLLDTKKWVFLKSKSHLSNKAGAILI